MQTYMVTDPTTERVVRLKGDSPPTEQELEEIFSQLPMMPRQDTPEPTSPLPEVGQTMKDVVMGVTHPGFKTTLQDAALLNVGNEAQRGVGAVWDAGKQAVRERTFEGFSGNIADSYRKNIDQDDELKKIFRKDYPKTALAASLGLNMAGGTVATKALNPQTWKGLTTLGGIEGGVSAWGDAVRGEKTKAGGKGIVGGAGVTALLPPVVKGVGKIPGVFGSLASTFSKGKPKVAPSKMTQGFGRIFGAEAPEETLTRQAIAEGEEALANSWQRSGGTAEQADALSKQTFNKGETFADVTPQQTDPLLFGLTSRNDSMAQKGGSYAKRAEGDTVVNRVASELGADRAAINTSIKYQEALKKTSRGIGNRIDDRIRELHGIPIKNLGELEEFINTKKIKSLHKEVVTELEADELKLQYNSHPGKVDDKGIFISGEKDVNSPILDEAYVDQLGKAIQEKITEAEEIGVSSASWMKQKRKLRRIAKESTGDKVLNSLRGRYNISINNEQAFRKGLKQVDEFDKPLNTEGLIKTLSGLDEAGKKLFQRGALAHYANKKDNLLKMLGSTSEREKIGLIFGGSKAKAAKELVDREQTFKTTSELVASGTSAQGQQIAKDTLAGDLDGIETLFKRLENKRAYSGIGVVGLAVNEVISILHQTSLSDEAVDVVFKNLAASGTEINKIYKRIAQIDLPKLARDKVLKAEMKTFATALAGGSGAAMGGLIPRLTTGYIDGD